MNFRLNLIVLSIFLVTFSAFPQKIQTPIPLIVSTSLGVTTECNAIGFFYKYHAETVTIEGTQDSFNIENERGVNRLSLKYLVSAEFKIEEIRGKRKIYCEWTARFPGSKANEVFKGHYPRDLENVYNISLVCVGSQGEYYIDVRTIQNIKRK
jgi:hypothetical protein